MRERRFWVIGLLFALVVAGGLSLFASESPDGLEKVAQDNGFLGTATDSAASSSPFADYQASFLDGAVGRGLAGIVGVLLTLLLFTALIKVLSKPTTADGPSADATSSEQD